MQNNKKRRTTLIGYGNVGKRLKDLLSRNNISIDHIVRSTGIYDVKGDKIDEKDNFCKYIDEDTVVFISLPSVGDGSDILNYYLKSLEQGVGVVTCEKAVLANNWELMKKYKNKIKYSATVGGDSGILDAISDYKGNINEIKAVVNGTLNYISEKLLEGKNVKDIYEDVTKHGFAEPGSNSFEEVIKNELQDVVYKTVILANHSSLCDKIISPIDIEIEPYKNTGRCAVIIKKNFIKAGFQNFKDSFWFPSGVNNVLSINGIKVAEGLGSGGKITARKMFKDYLELL